MHVILEKLNNNNKKTVATKLKLFLGVVAHKGNKNQLRCRGKHIQTFFFFYLIRLNEVNGLRAGTGPLLVYNIYYCEGSY